MCKSFRSFTDFEPAKEYWTVSLQGNQIPHNTTHWSRVFAWAQKHSPEVFCEKVFLKILSPFLIKLQAFRTATLLKKDSNTGVLLSNLWNIYEHLLWRTAANDCFCEDKFKRSFQDALNPLFCCDRDVETNTQYFLHC